MGVFGTIKKLAKPIYKVGKTAVNWAQNPTEPIWDIAEWVDPTGTVEKVREVVEVDNFDLIKRYPAEAAQIGVAVLAKYPGLAAPAINKIVNEELHRRINGLKSMFSSPETNDDMPDTIQQGYVPNGYDQGQFNNGYAAPQNLAAQPMMPAMITYWYWQVMYPYPIVQVICPWFYYRPHLPMYIPLPYFAATRGMWTQCGFCGSWSFTP